MTHTIKFLSKRFVTHDTKSFILEKPEGFECEAGQHISIILEGKIKPFTLTSIPSDLVLELIIKKYPGGLTEKIHEFKSGQEIKIAGPLKSYKFEGKGVFIAGGAGATPFLSILRQLKEDKKLEGNKLIFSNKKHEDVINEQEFRALLGDKAIFVLTKEKREGFHFGRVDKKFLEKNIKDFSQKFYICGPKEFVKSIRDYLLELGAKEEDLF